MVLLEILRVVSTKFVQLCFSYTGTNTSTVGCFPLEKCPAPNIFSGLPAVSASTVADVEVSSSLLTP